MSFIDRLAEIATGPIMGGNTLLRFIDFLLGFGLGVRILGPLFVLGFYVLLGLHVYTYFSVIMYVLKRRLGTCFGLIWVAIGLSLVYNIFYNHFFATFLKPGSPLDLKVKLKEKI